jgi:hypothetical protein
MTPILMTPSVYSACAVPAAPQNAARAIKLLTMDRITYSSQTLGFELLPIHLQGGIGDHVDHPTMLDHVVAVRHRRGEAEGLFRQ